MMAKAKPGEAQPTDGADDATRTFTLANIGRATAYYVREGFEFKLGLPTKHFEDRDNNPETVPQVIAVTIMDGVERWAVPTSKTLSEMVLDLPEGDPRRKAIEDLMKSQA